MIFFGIPAILLLNAAAKFLAHGWGAEVFKPVRLGIFFLAGFGDKERHPVENQIGKLKHFRRVFSRFDTLAKNYLNFIYFASSVVWLR